MDYNFSILINNDGLTITSILPINNDGLTITLVLPIYNDVYIDEE